MFLDKTLCVCSRKINQSADAPGTPHILIVCVFLSRDCRSPALFSIKTGLFNQLVPRLHVTTVCTEHTYPTTDKAHDYQLANNRQERAIKQHQPRVCPDGIEAYILL